MNSTEEMPYYWKISQMTLNLKLNSKLYLKIIFFNKLILFKVSCLIFMIV